MIVYVSEQGAVVGRQRGLLVVSKAGSVLQRVHLLTLEQLVLFGRIQISTQALRSLLERGVDTVLLTMSGRFLGRLSSGLSKNIVLRRYQFQKMEDPTYAVTLAKQHVEGKLRNCLTLLRRHNRLLKNDQVARDAAGIRHVLAQLERAEQLDTVRGYEGAGSARYFSALRAIFRAPGMAFFRRARRPPPDPINILLSLGYTLLTNLVHGYCEASGLDPFLGTLHMPHYGRPSLALDLIEEMRPVLVDSTAIRAVNTRALGPGDFQRVVSEDTDGEEEIARAALESSESLDADPQNAEEAEAREADERAVASAPRSVLITSIGLKKWLLAFERRLDETTYYDGTGTRLMFRQVLREQVYRLARDLRGETPYRPFLTRT